MNNKDDATPAPVQQLVGRIFSQQEILDAVNLKMDVFWACCEGRHPAFDMERIEKAWNAMVYYITNNPPNVNDQRAANEAGHGK
jgi:hypothetical protein